MNYRSDIDGLRAIAVLMVVFYHAGFSFIPGGFVGVDIFFVVSGYLITSILHREIQDERFTFTSFYTRRIKRILPAFYVVGFATLGAGYFLLLPADYAKLSMSFLSASTFLANFFFWFESGGYFSGAADEMPLLHTWSLSVEEQFYFFWPVFLVIASKFLSSGKLILLTIVAIVASFSLAEVLSRQASVLVSGASYFLLPTKIGELLLGALLALSSNAGKNLTKVSSNILAVIALALIIVPSLTLTKESIFPGIYSFIPCLGAMLMIYSGRSHQTICYKLLSLKPMVFIGLISYSLYLWHWPIIAFARYLQYEFTLFVGVVLTLVSVAVAYLSWKYVETPTRHSNGFGVISLKYFLLPLIACIGSVYIVNQFSGFSGRLDNNSQYFAIKESIKGPSTENGWCHDYSEKSGFDCLIGDSNGEINALLWGDSHGGTYSPFVDALAKQLGIRVTSLTYSGCTPFIVDKGNGANPALCRKSRNYAMESLESGEYDVVIIGARVDTLLKSFRLNVDDYFDAIEFTSKRTKKVIVLGQVPIFEADIASISLRKAFLEHKMNSKRKIFETDEWVDSANEKLQAFVQSFDNVDMLSTGYLFQNNGQYSPVDEGVLLYSDTNHLNILGAQHLARKYIDDERGSIYLQKLERQLSDF